MLTARRGRLRHCDFFEDTEPHFYGNNLSSVLSWPHWRGFALVFKTRTNYSLCTYEDKEATKNTGKASPDLIFFLILSEKQEELKVFPWFFFHIPLISWEFFGGGQYYDSITFLKIKKNHKIASLVEENWTGDQNICARVVQRGESVEPPTN